MKAHTKEEKFLLALFREAKAKGDMELEMDSFEIGQQIGLHPRGIDTICNGLAQANFIKKRGGGRISLTENGLRLIETIQGE